MKRRKNDSMTCDMCGKDILKSPPDDYYMLEDRVWTELCRRSGVKTGALLCRACGEKALGRRFVRSDYSAAPINWRFLGDE